MPERALWITRFDYRSPADIERAIERSAELGFDTVLFQVRGNATVFYRSDIEPWAEQLDWKDPGFDPLDTALRAAHGRGLRLHAWVNVMPGWWGASPPASGDHLYYKRPEWFWFDQHGDRQALCERFYVSLNPCLPAVRAYLTEVVDELVSRYPIDGLHLDYLRFPNEAPATPEGSGLDYPRDPGTLARFRKATGTAPETDPEGWARWRAQQVTELLAQIRRAAKRRSPDIIVSAAVGADPDRALEHHQDIHEWLARGLLDAVMPMNYTANEQLFLERLAHWRSIAKGTHVVMGTMVAQGDTELRAAQVREASTQVGAVAVFAYGGLFDSSDDSIAEQDHAAREARFVRRKTLGPVLRAGIRADTGADTRADTRADVKR